MKRSNPTVSHFAFPALVVLTLAFTPLPSVIGVFAGPTYGGGPTAALGEPYGIDPVATSGPNPSTGDPGTTSTGGLVAGNLSRETYDLILQGLGITQNAQKVPQIPAFDGYHFDNPAINPMVNNKSVAYYAETSGWMGPNQAATTETSGAVTSLTQTAVGSTPNPHLPPPGTLPYDCTPQVLEQMNGFAPHGLQEGQNVVPGPVACHH